MWRTVASSLNAELLITHNNSLSGGDDVVRGDPRADDDELCSLASTVPYIDPDDHLFLADDGDEGRLPLCEYVKGIMGIMAGFKDMNFVESKRAAKLLARKVDCDNNRAGLLQDIGWGGLDWETGVTEKEKEIFRAVAYTIRQYYLRMFKSTDRQASAKIIFQYYENKLLSKCNVADDIRRQTIENS